MHAAFTKKTSQNELARGLIPIGGNSDGVRANKIGYELD